VTTWISSGESTPMMAVRPVTVDMAFPFVGVRAQCSDRISVTSVLTRARYLNVNAEVCLLAMGEDSRVTSVASGLSGVTSLTKRRRPPS
jgi:hypothetical protein